MDSAALLVRSPITNCAYESLWLQLIASSVSALLEQTHVFTRMNPRFCIDKTEGSNDFHSEIRLCAQLTDQVVSRKKLKE